jgi:isoaspartyl peptidase/L-asparaginase-like protein (Ntn-hydrolase superfamily)
VDGPKAAAVQAGQLLARGDSPLDAVVRAAVILEDDPRFNAGTGSSIRADGKTIEMDASCMDDTGHFGAVTLLRRIKNPVLVARAVMDTRHIALGGAGAQSFAAELGFGEYDPTTEGALKKFRAFVEREGRGPDPFEKDTVGAVATDGKRFAASLSTGGITGSRVGRIGDVPSPGCGLFAGPQAAVAATGTGEEIARRALAHEAYQRLARGEEPAAVVADLIEKFPAEHDLGLIVVSGLGGAGGSNRRMAWAEASGA